MTIAVKHTNIIVENHVLTFGDRQFHCAVGKSGFSGDKKEGDGCTPLGSFTLRECWYRADRLAAPKTGLPLRVITPQDGWCDDAGRGEYNRHILTSPLPLREGQGEGASHTVPVFQTPPLPNPPPQEGREFSFERLWRDDHVYDVIVPLDYNDDPVIPGKGSAIFLHVARPDYAPTEGCVALALPDLLELLVLCDCGTIMEIKAK